jgi:type VI secretion system protein ImpJ
MNRPFWPRTLHLCPAHLQARDGYVEDLLTLRAGYCAPDAWGVLELALDEAAGASGEVVVQRLEAILPSGLVVHVDQAAPLRRRLALAPGAPSVWRDVFVGVPRAVLRGPNVTLDGAPVRSTRFVALASKNPTDLPGMRAKPEILLGDEDQEGFEVLRLGRVECVGQSLRFDRASMATVLRVRASAALEQGARKVVAALEARKGELARYRADHPLKLRAVAPDELPGLLLAVAVQRYLPLLTDVLGRRSAHQRDLYETLVALHGALMPFAPEAEVAPAYSHDQPEAVFPWLFDRIVRLVEMAARDRTTILQFGRVDGSRFRLPFDRRELAGKRPLLVLRGADETFLREKVLNLLKMASPAAIKPLLDSAIRGVAVAVEFEPPNAVPRREGVVAYRIDTRDKLWLDIEDRQHVELQLLGAPASLEAYLYAVERLA